MTQPNPKTNPPSPLPNVLVVEDDPRLSELLVDHLNQNGFATFAATDASKARRVAAKTHLDVAILDLMLPGEDGISLAEFLHKRYNLPLIMLTAVSEMGKRYQAFKIGVDDYITKPFEPQELVYRLRAILRRSGKVKKGRLAIGGFVYDLANSTLTLKGTEVSLTTAQRELLSHLAGNHGKLQSRLSLAKALGTDGASRNVDVHIKRLRDKLAGTSCLKTVHGKGYILEAEPINP